jgi:GTP pyrophosphokinase
VHSNRARSKVRQWFKAQQHEETVAQGRRSVERELARWAARRSSSMPSPRRRVRQAEDFFAAFARDDINRSSADGDPRGGATRAGRGAGEPAGRNAQSRAPGRAAASSSSASIA